ncbi:MAG: MFS transporter, partial [Verrucomicrobiota bacterium]
FSKIIPQEKSAEFFGFYNMLGKFAAIIGPLMVGVVSSLTGNPRMAIASILILFIGGAYFLLKVKDEEISNSQGS